MIPNSPFQRPFNLIAGHVRAVQEQLKPPFTVGQVVWDTHRHQYGVVVGVAHPDRDQDETQWQIALRPVYDHGSPPYQDWYDADLLTDSPPNFDPDFPYPQTIPVVEPESPPESLMELEEWLHTIEFQDAIRYKIQARIAIIENDDAFDIEIETSEAEVSATYSGVSDIESAESIQNAIAEYLSSQGFEIVVSWADLPPFMKEATSSRWEPIDMRFSCRQNHKDISRSDANKLLQEIHRRDHLGMDWDEIFERALMLAQQGEITLTDLPEDFDPSPESIEELEEMPWE